MNADVKQPQSTNNAPSLDEYSAQAIEILTAQPSRLARILIFLLTAMLLAGFAWSFVGEANTIVTASGSLGPESDERMVFTPVPGRLQEIYIAEGATVAKGDVIARVDAPGAIQLISGSLNSRLKLQEAQAAYDLFPTREKSLLKDIELVEFQIAAAEKEHKIRTAEGTAKLAEEQRLKLEKARLNLDKASQEKERARREMESHERLFNSEGGGGISKSKLEEKQHDYETKSTEFDLAQAALSEFEVKLSADFAKGKQELQAKSEALMRFYILLEQKKVELSNARLQVDLALRQAKIEAQAAEQVRLDDVDEDNLLKVRAPADGIVTRIANSQIGAKVEPKTPIAGLAPADVRSVLHIEIREQDRAFLKEGMAVKLKFNAFPYQRFGFIDGTLEYIAPSATISATNPQSQTPIYKGRVSLAKNHFSPRGEDIRIPIRYGMTAQAEIVVKQRRLIDLALDPLRRNTS